MKHFKAIRKSAIIDKLILFLESSNLNVDGGPKLSIRNNWKRVFSVFAFKEADFINACHINDKYGRFTLWLLKEIFTLATK